MAVNKPKSSSAWTMLHFLSRFIGLTGLAALAVGCVVWFALNLEEAGQIIAIAGAIAAGLALLVELRALASFAISHRGAAGFNVVVQIILAAVLLVGGNVFSFYYYKRIDCTRDQTFTLPSDIKSRLAGMRGDTDIIVFLQHVSFGQRVDLRQDEYDQAAEKIIVGKVRDLAEQFQELGPRFRVHVLDTQKRTYNERKKDLERNVFGATEEATAEVKQHATAMMEAIKKAPEDSIFFYSRDNKQIQRLSFNDIYQLDKAASNDANEKKGNLVLKYQGVKNFADKVVNIDEKKPRIAFGVVHEVLGQDGSDDLGMAGLKKALATRGFEGRDIVLKKWPERTAAALEPEESRYEILDNKKATFERVLKAQNEELKDLEKAYKTWHGTPLPDLQKEYVIARTNRGFMPLPRIEIERIRKQQGVNPITREFTAADRDEMVAEITESLEEIREDIKTFQKKLAKAIEEQSKLRVENLAEQRRITDVRAKFKRLVADVDMLVVPRATMLNLMARERISGRVYSLDDTQIESIKDFIKAGKPVLFCLGPMNEPGDDGFGDGPRDSLEKLLESFKIQLTDQTILFDAEGDAMAERDDSGELQGKSIDIPPATFEWKAGKLFGGIDPNVAPPIRTSLRLTARSLGDKLRSDLQIRHPRPIYVMKTVWPPESIASSMGALALPWPAGPAQALAKISVPKMDESKVFLMTDGEAWNEEKPFVTEKHVPRFERPKAGDTNKGFVQEKRRGPFPIGVALETDVPNEWYDKDAPATPTKVRLAVIGHGGLFIGKQLPPMREKLFVDVSNWLLGRENLLVSDEETWQYPRVKIDGEVKTIWEWGARLFLPLSFLYIGAIVMMMRRMR